MDTFENFMYIHSKKAIETIILKEYVGTNSVVTVPAEIDGVPVVRLSATFKDNKTVEKVVIPENIRTIAKDTFVNCPNLKEIVLPSSLEVIKVGTFKDIPKLGKLVYNGDKFELKDTSIVECTKLYDKQGFFILGNMLVACDGENEVVEIPEGITQIENSVFYHRLEIKKVIMPNSVRVIKANAFGCCKNLADLTLSQNLEYIRTYAFGYCSSLTELNIPPSVKMIYKCAFVGCNIKNIKIDHNPIVQKDSFSYGLGMVKLPKCVINSFSREAMSCFCIFGLSKWEQLSKLEHETITEELENKFIRNVLFYKYQSDEVSCYFSTGFGLELDELDEYLAFSIEQNDTVKTAILLEYKKKHFSKEVLQDYQDNQEMIEIGLEMPTLEQLKRNWGISIYEDKITITGYNGSKPSESIPQATDEGLPIISIASSNTNDDFHPIQKLFIPDGVEEIRPRAFYKTSTLREITLPESINFIGKLAFAKTSLKEITLPQGITDVAPSLFLDCNELESVTLPNSIEIIDRKAFEKCVSLVEIVLPPNVKSIGKQAFKGCTSLKRVILTCDINIDNIESDCFDNCLSIEFVGLINGENII